MKTWKEFVSEETLDEEDAILKLIIKHGMKTKGKLEVQRDGDVSYVTVNAKLNQQALKDLSKYSVTVVYSDMPNTFDIIFV